MLVGKTSHDARKELRERWRSGNVVKCPECGCLAQQWRDTGAKMVMRCEDCGRRETARYNPFNQGAHFDD